jgi:hypothetical protein
MEILKRISGRRLADFARRENPAVSYSGFPKTLAESSKMLPMQTTTEGMMQSIDLCFVRIESWNFEIDRHLALGRHRRFCRQCLGRSRVNYACRLILFYTNKLQSIVTFSSGRVPYLGTLHPSTKLQRSRMAVVKATRPDSPGNYLISAIASEK